MVNIGQSKKYLENFSASRVALVTISLKSCLTLRRFLSRPNNTSVCIVRSIYNKTITEYIY